MSTRRRILILTAVLAVLAAGVVLLGQGGEIVRVVGGIGDVDPLLAGLGLFVCALAITNRGLLTQASHRAVGLDAGLDAMTRTATVGFAAQKLVKSAGAAGLAVFVRHGRRRGHAPAAVVAACVLSAFASFVALGIVLAATIAVVTFDGGMNGWWVAAAAGFGICAVAVVVVAIAVLRSRTLAQRWWRRGARLLARLRRRPAPEADSHVIGDLLDAVDRARQRPGALRRVVAFAVLSKALGALSFGIAVAAVGLPVGVDTAIVIYGTALAASLVSIVPGGVGTVEGSTAALLIASGASAGAAALAVALFRILDLWLPLAAGAVAARGELRSVRDEDRAEHPVVVPVDSDRMGSDPIRLVAAAS